MLQMLIGIVLGGFLGYVLRLVRDRRQRSSKAQSGDSPHSDVGRAQAPDIEGREFERLHGAPPEKWSVLRRMFGEPKLPGTVAVMALVIIITDTAFTLIAQPPDYWLDYDRVVEYNPLANSLLRTGPIFFIVGSLVYLAVVCTLLGTLAHSLALVLWMITCFAHLSASANWINSIFLGYEWSLEAARAIYYVYEGLFSAILGVVLYRTLICRYQRSTDMEQANHQSMQKAGLLRWSWCVGVWLILLGIGVFQVINPSKQGWRPLAPKHRPDARYKAAVTYDTRREKAVLFGGGCWVNERWDYEKDTWEWDGKDWVQTVKTGRPLNSQSKVLWPAVTLWLRIERGIKNWPL